MKKTVKASARYLRDISLMLEKNARDEDYEKALQNIQLAERFCIAQRQRLRYLPGTLGSQKTTTGARPAVFEKFSDRLCAVSTLARSLTNRRSSKG